MFSSDQYTCLCLIGLTLKTEQLPGQLRWWLWLWWTDRKEGQADGGNDGCKTCEDARS